MIARFVTRLARDWSCYARSMDWWHSWYLRERLVVLKVVMWKSDAKRSRRQEAGRNRALLAVTASVLHVRRNYLMERLAVTWKNDRVLLTDRPASRRACHLSAGHRTGRSRQSNPS
jgi:hypothetical protein